MLLDVKGPAACANSSPGQLSSGKVIPLLILVSNLTVTKSTEKLTAASAESMGLVVALAKAGSSLR